MKTKRYFLGLIPVGVISLILIVAHLEQWSSFSLILGLSLGTIYGLGWIIGKNED